MNIFYRREQETAKLSQRLSAITPFLMFSAVIFNENIELYYQRFEIQPFKVGCFLNYRTKCP